MVVHWDGTEWRILFFPKLKSMRRIRLEINTLNDVLQQKLSDKAIKQSTLFCLSISASSRPI